MPFIVMNSVQASKDAFPAIVLEVQRLDFEALRAQPGFRFARLMIGESETELIMLTEWASREAFMAYRQSDVGKRVVDASAHLHPKISFYEVLDASFDRAG